MKIVDSIRHFVFPELSRVVQRDVRSTIERRVIATPRCFLVGALLFLVIHGLATAMLLPLLWTIRTFIAALGAPAVVWGGAIAAVYLGYLGFAFGFPLVSMRLIMRRELRYQLTRSGWPTCIACGHDLHGGCCNRCTECGAPEVSTDQAKRCEQRNESLIAPLTSFTICCIIGLIGGLMIGQLILAALE